MRAVQILAGLGGHRIITGTSLEEGYFFSGFIPITDTTIGVLTANGSTENVAQIGVTYGAGIYYPCTQTYYTSIQLATGSVVVYLTESQPE